MTRETERERFKLAIWSSFSPECIYEDSAFGGPEPLKRFESSGVEECRATCVQLGCNCQHWEELKDKQYRKIASIGVKLTKAKGIGITF